MSHSYPRQIYKISPAPAWFDAERTGFFGGSADDLRDGFIHFSTAEQAPGTAAKFFAGQSDLVIAAIETGALGDALKWEVSRGGMLFPHLYAPLPMTAVLWTKLLPIGGDGAHVFPREMV